MAKKNTVSRVSSVGSALNKPEKHILERRKAKKASSSYGKTTARVENKQLKRTAKKKTTKKKR